ncbi:MAG TPA: methyl-accepting chemotaxis protein, partial [Spirillospora sp.]|nr:methyl-accepting chemotaxis protein [Spirillospora sp.]
MSDLSPTINGIPRRLNVQVLNATVLLIALVTAVPVLLLGLTTRVGDTLVWWTLGAFVGGGFVGVLVTSGARRGTEEVLNRYVLTLERIAGGDLRERLDTSGIDSSSDEGQMLARLGRAINLTLDRVQNVAEEIGDALKRMDMDTRAILEATARQIAMANEQDNVVTETTATVNEVRATVTETAERAQSVAETAQVSVDIS